MKGFQLEIDGNWGHFKKPETNNNPLTHDLITKTALIGMIGAVLGIERQEMKELFPILSNNLLYGVCLLNPVKKISWGFTSKTAINPTGSGSPKYFEFLKDPAFLVSVALANEHSAETCNIFNTFQTAIEKGTAIYTPILGWHNCPANLSFISSGDFTSKKENVFETKGFVIAGKHIPQDVSGEFRIGFDKLPTYQNNDFWNLPDKYVNVIYPDYPHFIKVKGEYYEYCTNEIVEKWCLI
jgi:CRISPR-associated protein Cas5h